MQQKGLMCAHRVTRWSTGKFILRKTCELHLIEIVCFGIFQIFQITISNLRVFRCVYCRVPCHRLPCTQPCDQHNVHEFGAMYARKGSQYLFVERRATQMAMD